MTNSWAVAHRSYMVRCSPLPHSVLNYYNKFHAPTAPEHKYDKTRIENWLPTGTDLKSSRLVTNSHNHYTQLLLRKVIIFYIPIHKVLEQLWRHFTSLQLRKCSQIRHPSTRVSSSFCTWQMWRFDTSYKRGKPFPTILKPLSLTCVICCK